MKTMLYALAAVALTASAAVAEPTPGRSSPASEAASVKSPAGGDRVGYERDRMPVSLNRDFGFESQSLDRGQPVGERGWTGNDNEG